MCCRSQSVALVVMRVEKRPQWDVFLNNFKSDLPLLSFTLEFCVSANIWLTKLVLWFSGLCRVDAGNHSKRCRTT